MKSEISDCRELLCKRFFYSTKNTDSCLNYLLPEIRNSATVHGLRNPQYLVAERSRTSQYQKSFIIHALSIYQWLSYEFAILALYLKVETSHYSTIVFNCFFLN